MNADVISVLLVEDHEILSQSLAMALRSVDMQVEVADDLAHEAIMALVRAMRPQVTLLDLNLGGESTSLGMIGELVVIGTTVIVLTASEDPSTIGAALHAGALAAVRKSQPFDQLVDVIREGVAGRSAMSVSSRIEAIQRWEQAINEQRPMLARFRGLTAREAEVLELLVAGRVPAEIADEQYVAVSTVRSQLKAIYRKLGVNSQLAAVALARRAGWQRPR